MNKNTVGLLCVFSSFITKTRQYCVHPKAKWLPEKLRELEEVSLENTLLCWINKKKKKTLICEENIT